MRGTQLVRENLFTARLYDLVGHPFDDAFQLVLFIHMVVMEFHSSSDARFLKQIQQNSQNNNWNAFSGARDRTFAPHLHHYVFFWAAHSYLCFLLLFNVKEPLQIHPIFRKTQIGVAKIIGRQKNFCCNACERQKGTNIIRKIMGKSHSEGKSVTPRY